MLQSVAPGSPADDPVRGLVPCFFLPRLLHSGASFYRILSVASDAPVRGTGFSPGRSSPGAWAVLLSTPDAPIRGVFLSYSLLCLGRSSPWLQVHPRTIQSGGSGRAPLRPGCSDPGCHVSYSLCCRCGRLLEWCFGAFFFHALRRCSSPASPRSVVLGTLSRAAVSRVLCALPGFAAPGGRCGLAPVLVPWLWPAACLSGVPRGPALVRRSSSGPVALGAPVGFPVTVVPSPTPRAVAPGITGCLRGARGGRPRSGLMCLPLARVEARALGALRVVPVRGPAMGLSLAGPSGFGLGLRALR